MNLHMMRDVDHNDPIGGLGPRVTPAPTPAPQPVRRPDGIVVGPDGKLSTDFPPPPPEPSWPFPTGTAAPAPEPEPGAHGFMLPPVGSFIRLLRPRAWCINESVGAVCKVIRHYSDDGMTIDGPSGTQWGIHATDESDEEHGPCWERVA